jgi:ABC-2 type transport system ATP-binding protein
MLHEPPLLFLDEPTSGLDPEASRTVRDFIEQLRGEGRTFFLCTHNLDEADRLCDYIGVIKRRLIRVDAPARLRASLYGHSVAVRLRVVAPEHIAAVEALPFVQGVQHADDCLSVQLQEPEANNPRLVRALVAAGADIRYVEQVEHSLEAVYFDLLAETAEQEAG